MKVINNQELTLQEAIRDIRVASKTLTRVLVALVDAVQELTVETPTDWIKHQGSRNQKISSTKQATMVADRTITILMAVFLLREAPIRATTSTQNKKLTASINLRVREVHIQTTL